MADIDPYVRILFFQKYGKVTAPSSPIRRIELLPVFVEHVDALLAEFGFPNITDSGRFSEVIIDELIEAGVIHQETMKFAGEYLTLDPTRFGNYRDSILVKDPIYSVSQRIGPRFFPDTFNGYTASFNENSQDIPLLGLAPASSRIVTFSDNQITDFEKDTSRIIDAVSTQNQVGEIVGFRELLLGQLKAGRELIRAGSFRLYFLQLTLIQSLSYLAERYEKEVIGGLAAALITALVKQIGIDA